MIMDPEVKREEAAGQLTPMTQPGRDDFAFSSDVVMLSDPSGARAEGVRTLRTHIMAQHVEAGRRGLAVCAASRRVGASFTAANLAVGLAQIGVKTLVVDGDLRTPSLEAFIRPPRALAGLCQLLLGERDLAESIQSDVMPNLAVMYAGGGAANAQELLAGEAFKEIIDQCMRDYDLTIIDTPPANTCADARRISTVVGYSLIVARRHETYVGDLTALAAQLAEDGAKVVGTVMNEA